MIDRITARHKLKNALTDIAVLAVFAAALYSVSAKELRIQRRLDNNCAELMLPPLNDVETAAPVNINTASAHQLTRVKGIGETKAAAIVEYREQHGAFLSVDDLVKVNGIGEKTLEKIRERLTV